VAKDCSGIATGHTGVLTSNDHQLQLGESVVCQAGWQPFCKRKELKTFTLLNSRTPKLEGFMNKAKGLAALSH
jgi:hypothetical protein